MENDVRLNLKGVIKDKGYIQAVIAKKSNLSPAKFSQILNLERRLEANELFDVCAAIDMTPMELKQYKPRLPEKAKEVT
ncbi:MAG: helix-turn-helix domain-containing protein [Lachnospiraceae bacterium]|nr:helix-turn-helix domain-containing protein [Lachnospiraceae bacterium]